MLYRVEGIVIRAVEYGEGGVIITLYTSNGKLGVMARGAKKLRSRHAAVTQLYTYGEYVCYKGSSGSLGTLNSAEIIDSFSAVRSDLRCSSYAAYLAELTDRMIPDGEASEFLFEQLKASLSALNDGKDPQIIAHLYEMKLFAFAGYPPVLGQCVSCGDSLGHEGPPLFFSVSTGGVLCSRCAANAADAMPLTHPVRKLLQILQATDARLLGNVNVNKANKLAIKNVLRRWMDTHAEVRLKTRYVLDQVESVYEN
jgi:DNA repair protein RecO (recombination protein O)